MNVRCKQIQLPEFEILNFFTNVSTLKYYKRFYLNIVVAEKKRNKLYFETQKYSRIIIIYDDVRER